MVSSRIRRKREDFIRDTEILCKTCDVWKPKNQYRYRPAGGRYVTDRWEGQCLPCRNEYRRANKFKLTVSDMRQLLQTPCAVCGSRDDLHLDHDHKCCDTELNTCGQCLRGVLCGPCNVTLGIMQDSSENLRKLADYLDSYRARCLATVLP